jgi:diacylglycerol kinase (ATP)
VLAVTVSGYFFCITRTEWIAIVLCFSIVLALELVNTATEKLCDTLHPLQSEKIKLVKDILAAAVLVAAIGAAVVGLIIFLPYCTSLFKS